MNKKVSLTFFAAVLAITISQVQNLQFGIKGGLNFANLHGDVIYNRYKIGPHLGAYCHIRVLDHVSISPELLYSLQGASYKEEGLNVDYKDHLHYINLPVMIWFFVNDHFSIHGGPYLGAFITGKKKGNNFGTEVNESIKNIKPLDFGLALGLAYHMNNGLTIGGRYNFGIADIAKDSSVTGNGDGVDYEYTYEMILHNRVLQIFVAYPLTSLFD